MPVGGIGGVNRGLGLYLYQIQNQNQIQTQTQVQGVGGSKRGMGVIMQQLSPDQRQQISTILQSLSEVDRQSLIEQIQQLDYTTLSQDELYNNIMGIINAYTSTINSATGVNIYA